jgi:hypothetical protein
MERDTALLHTIVMAVVSRSSYVELKLVKSVGSSDIKKTNTFKGSS